MRMLGYAPIRLLSIPISDFPTEGRVKRRRACPSFIFFPSMHPSPSPKRRNCVNYRSSFSSARIDFCHRDFCRPLSRNARGKFVELLSDILFILETFVSLRFEHRGKMGTRALSRVGDLYFFLSFIFAAFVPPLSLIFRFSWKS